MVCFSCGLLVIDDLYHAMLAFTLKTRGDFVAARSETDEGAYVERVKVANEIAQVLRKNLVQG